MILCAGGIASPQILMLSGLGPAPHLRQVGIPIVKDIPGVGGNLQSHVGTGELIFTLEKLVAFNPVRRSLDPRNILNYFINRRGPLAATSGFESFGNIRTQWAQPNTTWPDVAITFLGKKGHISVASSHKLLLTLVSRFFQGFFSVVVI